MREVTLDSFEEAHAAGAARHRRARARASTSPVTSPVPRPVPMGQLPTPPGRARRGPARLRDLRLRQPQPRDDQPAGAGWVRRLVGRRRDRRMGTFRDARSWGDPAARPSADIDQEHRRRLDDPPDRHPDAGRPQLPRPRRRRSPSWSTRSATSTGCSDLAEPRACRITHVFETHIHNDYVTGGLALAERDRRRLPRERRRRRLLRPHAGRATATSCRRRRRHAASGPRHARAHVHPPVLRARATTASRSAVFTGGSLLFGATGRPDLLGPDHTHELVRAPVRLGAPARRRAARRRADVFPTHGFGSFCSATQSRGHRVDDRAGEADQPGADPGRGALRRRAARRAGRLPRLLRAHGAGQRRRPRPRRTCRRPQPRRRRRAAPPDRGRGVGRRPAQPHRVRGRPRPGHPQLRARRRVRHLPRLADPVGHAADPARRDRRAGRRGAAGAGPHRHRPPGGAARPARPQDWSRPSRSAPSRGDVRRPRRRSATTARWSSSTCAATGVRRGPIDGAVHIPLHELPRRRRRGPRRRGLGALRRRLPRRRSPPPSSPPPDAALVAIDDAFDNAEAAGLHLITARDEGRALMGLLDKLFRRRPTAT